MTHVVRLPAPEGMAPATGYSHVTWGTGRLIAVSGLHLTLIAGLAYAAGRLAFHRLTALGERSDARRLSLLVAVVARQAATSIMIESSSFTPCETEMRLSVMTTLLALAFYGQASLWVWRLSSWDSRQPPKQGTPF